MASHTLPIRSNSRPSSSSTTSDNQNTPALRIPIEHLDEALRIFEHEESLLEDLRLECDIALIDAPYRAKYHASKSKRFEAQYPETIAEVVNAMRWRFRVQENFYLLAQGLDDAGLIDMELAVSKPIDWHHPGKRVSEVGRLLYGFALAEECAEASHDVGLCGRFDVPITWLAVLMARTCTDMGGAVEFIKTSGLLGGYDRSYAKGLDLDPFTVFSDGKAAVGGEKGCLPQFAFWLPQGQAGWLQGFRKRYQSLAGRCEECRPGWWDEDKMLWQQSTGPELGRYEGLLREIIGGST